MRIKELLREKNITQGELAKRMGITNGAVSQILNDKYAPKLDTLQRIADALEVDIAELFAPTIRCPHCGKTIVLPKI